MVSQTHDYDLPGTACCLQERLGIPKTCAAFDMALGCSGYIYGLWVCSTLLAAGSAKRVLLLASATALERDENAPPMSFVVGTDGAGRDYLIAPGSGYRNRVTAETIERRPGADGVLRSSLDLYMDGSKVFAFTLPQVPPLINDVLSLSGWPMDTMDAFVNRRT